MARHEHLGGTPAGTTGRPDVPSVVVHGEAVRVDRAHHDLPVAEVRSRFGGLDAMAVLAGLTSALGALLVLSTLLARLGVEGGGQVDRETLSVAGLVAGLLALGLSLLLGGYVAGRVARYSGVRNGLLTGLAFLLVTAGLSALAASAADGDAAQVGLPDWLDRDTATTAAIVTALVALALVLGASALGGRLGAGWHRKVDDTLLGTRAGGLTPYPAETLRGSTTTEAGR
jgi:hypothetical protein